MEEIFLLVVVEEVEPEVMASVTSPLMSVVAVTVNIPAVTVDVSVVTIDISVVTVDIFAVDIFAIAVEVFSVAAVDIVGTVAEYIVGAVVVVTSVVSTAVDVDVLPTVPPSKPEISSKSSCGDLAIET